jgi:Ino eighty subunit 1
LGVMATSRGPPLKPIAVNGNGTQRANDDTEEDRPAGRANKKDANGDVNMEDEDLEDVEKEVLGLVSGDEDEGGAEDLDEVDKELLGLGADETEEEASEGGMDVDN